jgi:hypothetical protein
MHLRGRMERKDGTVRAREVQREVNLRFDVWNLQTPIANMCLFNTTRLRDHRGVHCLIKFVRINPRWIIRLNEWHEYGSTVQEGTDTVRTVMCCTEATFRTIPRIPYPIHAHQRGGNRQWWQQGTRGHANP